jgi:5-methyltetrahydrofolate--homocysteine methyltransferase
MVACDAILKEAKAWDADFIGLSGLITPSLEEMIHNASEMKRLGFTQPLLIGGATTSKAHTAIKIAPHYPGPVVQVADASLVTEVCNQLLNPDKAPAFIDALKKDQDIRRERFLQNQDKTELLSLADARKNHFQTDWSDMAIKLPKSTDIIVETDIDLATIAKYIDWSPFFWAWELKGVYPKILEHKKYGTQAKQLHMDALKILDRIIQEKAFTAKSALRLCYANTVEDDIILYQDTSRETVLGTMPTLRQQKKKVGDPLYYSLSDFIAPRDSNRLDACGAFICSIENVDTFAKQFEDDIDDYTSILVKALGDRMAEALTEYTHECVRKHHWGYQADENLSTDALIKEEYIGIRPALGYPACPDHSNLDLVWQLLDGEKNTGATLTENFAISPASTVSGLYFAHERANYFHVGALSKEQMSDYAQRKNLSLAECERQLATNKGY